MLLPLSGTASALACLLFSPASAHRGGRPKQEPLSADISAETDWATKHMAEEHHISVFTPSAFFNMHDYDSSGGWTPDEVRRTYGLEDESNKGISAEKREEVTRETFRVFDVDKNGIIEQEEFESGWEEGRRLRDFELGPGHHGDDEWEYEIHHFEKFHDENTREEDLVHPEDIAHFAKHEREEAEAERQEQLDIQSSINEANIPAKFLRQP